MAEPITDILSELADEFDLLGDWEERYRYVIELGKGLAPLTDGEHSDENKVRGCASQVWLVSERVPAGGGGNDRLALRGASDAMIVQGLIAVLFAIYEGKSLDEILVTDTQAIFTSLGLKEHLTPQRSNGLRSMVERIRSDAAALAGA